jgi:hypothetical protein
MSPEAYSRSLMSTAEGLKNDTLRNRNVSDCTVVVGATLLHGKSDFEKYHTRLLSGRFHDMTLE